jgi:tetratricopeptide (TPR) repeat protein
MVASLYGETKRYKESETMFTKAIEMNPSYTEAYFNLGK